MDYNTLRTTYLDDLREGYDPTHGKKKVRYIDQWEKLFPIITTEQVIWEDVLLRVWKGELNIWVWSDIHFGHKNIIRYTGRPYPNHDLMNQCLIGNYLNVVQPQDIVIWGGDITFMNVPQTIDMIDPLPGRKVLVYGNHDIDHKGVLTGIEKVFDECHLCFPIPVIDEDITLLFTHYPMDDTNIPTRCVNVHGHIHQHLAGGKHINMCVEHTNYAPKNLKDVILTAKQLVQKYDE